MAILRAGPVLMLLLLMAGLALLEPVFLTPRNIGNVLAQTAVISVLAMGQFMVIVSRGVDLSVGANVALASVVGALAFSTIDAGLAIVVVMVVSGLAVGAVNGFVLVKGRMPHPFIVTLASMSVARGLALWVDLWNIETGADWDAAIDRGLHGCANFLIILSPDAGGVTLRWQRIF